MQNKFDSIELAKRYLRGEDISAIISIKELCKILVVQNQFGYAVDIHLEEMNENEENGIANTESDYQYIARNIYKDTTLSSYYKYDKAISILNSYCNLSNTDDCETLGLAGAIYKNKWKFNGQFKNLNLSLLYYKKGYTNWKDKINSFPIVETDSGFTAINFAFINELTVVHNLEQLTKVIGMTDEMQSMFRTAQEVRFEILNVYLNNPDEYQPSLKGSIKPYEWIYATIAEAYFGVRKYAQALYFISLYMAEKSEDWQMKTFRDQLYNIAYFQKVEKTYSRENNDPFNSSEIIESEQIKCLLALDFPLNNSYTDSKDQLKEQSKLGLGLSGGGFRSALFHIGVLAGLAEKDVLKDIQVISCVSGGSIIGAFYYLKLKNLLESKEDHKINKEDYINLVKEIEEEFLSAVQKNIRMRIFSNLFKNIKMFTDKNYSRSHRLGELYEEFFYYNLLSGNVGKYIYMEDLIIHPLNNEIFNINQDNGKRKNKVPQLVLNATSVNTGHNWQFTATWMGEPPTYISDDFDVKPRLRRMYYKNAPNKYKNFRLGYAVAASSCVPVLFEPLKFTGIYQNIDLELVDGGVHDNQGITSILEQECNRIIISDGSSQMNDESNSSTNGLSLFFRVDNILQERLRETQLLDLKAREYSSALSELHIVHLKNGLNQLPVSWIDCTDVDRKILKDNEITDENSLLKYGIMKKIQKLLSEVRTDLDSFNDLEAYALMNSGYQQTLHISLSNESSDWNKNKELNWKFKKIEDYCREPSKCEKLINQLNISKMIPFKVVKLSKPIKYSLILIGIFTFVFSLYFLTENWNKPVPFITCPLTYKWFGSVLFFLLLGLTFKKIAAISNYEAIIKKKVILLALIVIGWIISNLYIWIVNRIYNFYGKLD